MTAALESRQPDGRWQPLLTGEIQELAELLAEAVARGEPVRLVGSYLLPESLIQTLGRACQRADALSLAAAEADYRLDFSEGERLRAESLAAEDAAIEEIVDAIRAHFAARREAA